MYQNTAAFQFGWDLAKQLKQAEVRSFGDSDKPAFESKPPKTTGFTTLGGGDGPLSGKPPIKSLAPAASPMPGIQAPKEQQHLL